MENNFIQMAASTGHAVTYMIGPIFKHIIDCVQLYFTNGFTNIVLQSVNCLWLVGVTLIFEGTPQIIVQPCQSSAPRWPNHISSAANNAIFKNSAQNIECSFGCVASSAVLLKPNVANILLLKFCEKTNWQSKMADIVNIYNRYVYQHNRKKCGNRTYVKPKVHTVRFMRLCV